MASKHVEDAVEAYLAANWTACPVLTENTVGDAPSDGSAFLILQFPVADTERLSPTTRRYREQGGVRIVINLERGSGTALMRQYGEQLAALFRDVKVQDIHFLVPTEPFTDDRSDVGAYYQGAMVAPYWRTFSG